MIVQNFLQLLRYKISTFDVLSNSSPNKEEFSPHCPLDLPLTCQNTTQELDSCCFEYPSGVFLQTQFWNYRLSKPGLNETEIINEMGPLDSFTVRGLWPNNCFGSYEQFCDPSLFIDDVYHLLHESNDTIPLYHFMRTFWKGFVIGDDESLWIHEFNKHGSCINTIKPSCYSRWENISEMSLDDENIINEKERKNHSEKNKFKDRAVIDYFNITKNLFQKLDTYKILKDSNIVPSLDKSYTRDEILKALKKGFENHEVFFNCNKDNELHEIWYFHHLKGSLLEETFIPINCSQNPPYSRCKKEGIRYYPKGYYPSKETEKTE